MKKGIGIVFLVFAICNLQSAICNCSAADKSLVACWNFDEGEGKIAKDSSGNKNDGRIIKSEWVKGKFGSALQFDGENGYVACGNPSQDLSGDLTIEFWMNPANIGAGRINPICKSANGEFALTIEADGSLSFYHGKSDGSYFNWQYVILPDPEEKKWLTNDAWHHIAITRDSKNKVVTAYWNGVYQQENSYASYEPSKQSDPIYIGKGYCGYFAGIIDEVKIYNRVLTEKEIETSYNRKEEK